MRDCDSGCFVIEGTCGATSLLALLLADRWRECRQVFLVLLKGRGISSEFLN